MSAVPMADREGVELLVGSEMGRWTVGRVDPVSVVRVVTTDEEATRVARRRGIPVATRPTGAAIGLSVHYPLVLSDQELRGYGSIYNLHPGYLPWGRGHFPLVWAIWLGEPAGATLHHLVRRLDGGPLVDQRRLEVEPGENAYELYQRLSDLERSMFDEWWPRIASGRALPERPQPSGGSYHDKAEFQTLLATDIRGMSPRDIDRLRRALYFPGRPGLRVDATDAGP